MTSKNRITKRTTRDGKLTPAEAERQKKLRAEAKQDFPPAPAPTVPADSIGAHLRKARLAQGLTWYAVAKAAGIPHAGTVRNIELGNDAKLSTITAIATALGLSLEVCDAA